MWYGYVVKNKALIMILTFFTTPGLYFYYLIFASPDQWQHSEQDIQRYDVFGHVKDLLRRTVTDKDNSLDVF